MDRLIRETQPPAGSYPSPVPQYWNPETGQYERVYGRGGANRVQLYAHDGATLLPVKVDSEGRLVLAQEVSVGDVTVNVGPLGEVTLSGSSAVHTAIDLEPQLLNPGQSWESSRLDTREIAINGHLGARSVGLVIESDQPVMVIVKAGSVGSTSPEMADQDYIVHDGGQAATIMPIQPILGPWIVYRATNISTVPMTKFRLTALYSAIHEVEPLFTQRLPLDGGTINLGAGASYTSVLFRIPRVGRLTTVVSVPSDALEHTVMALFYRDVTSSAVVAAVPAADKVAVDGRDTYVISTPPITPYVRIRITNANADAGITAEASAFGYPR